MTDLILAHRNHLLREFRARHAIHPDLVTILGSVPRTEFVLEPYQHLAFTEIQIPLKVHGEYMLTPMLETKIMVSIFQACLSEGKRPFFNRILEIGTGSAYMTYLLSQCANTVVSCDIHAELLTQADTRLKAQKVTHVMLCHENGIGGLPDKGPYDLIVYTGALKKLPIQLSTQLGFDGKIFAILGEAPVMRAVCVTPHRAKTHMQHATLFETCIPSLSGQKNQATFEF